MQVQVDHVLVGRGQPNSVEGWGEGRVIGLNVRIVSGIRE